MTKKIGHFILFAVIALLFVSLIPPTPTIRAEPSTATVTGITFSQVDFFFNGSLVQPYSNWGEFTIESIPGDNVTFINVVANASGPNEWIIRNLPLFPSSLVSSGNESFSTYFDLGLLGVTNGVQLPSLYYSFTQSDTPTNSTPSVVPTQLASVGRDSALTNSGVPSGVTALGSPPAANVFDFLAPFVNVQISWHNGMPNVVQDKNQCGPGAAANSLQWLAQEHNWSLNNGNVSDTLKELVTDMGCDYTGTWDDAFANGKLAFAQRHNLTMENHYAGGEKLPTTGGYNGITRDGNATWNYVEQELDKGHDVEIMTATHWVVLTGKISWDSIHFVAYRDDPYQHGDATNDTEKAEIAKRHVWTSMWEDANGTLRINIGNGDEDVLTVFSESPKPLPAPPVALTITPITTYAAVYWYKGQALIGHGNGNPAIFRYNITVERTDADTNVSLLAVVISLKRVNGSYTGPGGRSDAYQFPNSTIVFLPIGGHVTVELDWWEDGSNPQFFLPYPDASNPLNFWNISAVAASLGAPQNDTSLPEVNDGQTIAEGPLIGDIKPDGVINILDAIKLGNVFLLHSTDPSWNPDADLHPDGVINILDAIILGNNFMKHFPL